MAENDGIGMEAVAGSEPVAIAETAPAADTIQGGIASEEGSQPSPVAGAHSPAGLQPPSSQPYTYTLTGDDTTPPLLKESLASYSEACRANGMTEAQAKAVMQWQTDRLAKAEAEQRRLTSQTLQQWNDEIRGDTEFGGSNYTRTIADARKALAAFDPDGSLRELLRLTHGQHEPSVVRFAARVGRAMGEHDYVTGSGLGSVSQTSLAERMYGKSGTEVKHPL